MIDDGSKNLNSAETVSDDPYHLREKLKEKQYNVPVKSHISLIVFYYTLVQLIHFSLPLEYVYASRGIKQG